jgi:hypothetical protein
MANNFNEFLRNAVLNYVFGGTAFTPAGTLYLGLSTTAITDAGTGMTEPTGGAYARVAITNNKTNFDTASGGDNTIGNATEISFAEATASWGTITHFFIYSAATGGNIYISGALDAPKTVAAGDIARFSAGSLTVSLDEV